MDSEQPEKGSPHLCALAKEGVHSHWAALWLPEAQMSETESRQERGRGVHGAVYLTHLQNIGWPHFPIQFSRAKFSIQTVQQH